MNEKELFRAASESALPDKSSIKLAAVSPPSRWRRFKTWIPAIAMTCALAVILCAVFPAVSPSVDPDTPISTGAASLYSPEEYGEIYRLLSEMNVYRDYGYLYDDVDVVEEDASSLDVITNASTANDTVDFSDTNLQAAGVQEADIIKTDGRYIYALDSINGRVTVVSVNGGEPTVASVITIPSYGSILFDIGEMYLCDDRLVVLGTKHIPYSSSDRLYYGYYGSYEATAVIYDVADRTAPAHIETVSQSGSLIDSRMIGDVLYLISNHSIRLAPIEDEPSTYVPATSVGDDCYTVAPDDIYLPAEADSAVYTVVSAYGVTDPALISTKALLGRSGTVYCSADSLYVTSSVQEFSSDDTLYDFYTATYSDISYLSLTDGVIELVASARIPGHLLNQFSLDKYDGYLRVVTHFYSYERASAESGASSTEESYNSLFVLDENLSVVGSITGLAQDELVYSVRFMGDVGYFVTFRQVDPLFAVDLSDPTSPRILSALKIPGFSDYLHPYSDGLLLGLGKNADETTGRTGCIKLSMFDISDPTSVTEQDKYDVADVYWTEANSNHKAIIVNSEKGLIGFATHGCYFIYGYGEDGFFEKASVDLYGTLDNYHSTSVRGMNIDDMFYIVCANGIVVLSLADMSVVFSLTL